MDDLYSKNILLEIVKTKMPYGKFKGMIICNLPIHYLEWFNRQGFPPNKLGVLLSTVYEIKLNGLDEIIRNIKKLNRQFK